MSEASKSGQGAATSGATTSSTDATSGAPENKSADQQYSKEAFSKLLREKQNYQKANEEATVRLAEYEQGKLEAEGKLKEALENQKKRTSDSEEKYKQLFSSVANKTLKQQFAMMAQGKGCLDTDLAYLAMDFSDIEISKELDFDMSALEQKVEAQIKVKPLLYKKDAKLPNDVPPTGSGSSGPDLSLKKLSTEELIKLI